MQVIEEMCTFCDILALKPVSTWMNFTGHILRPKKYIKCIHWDLI